MKDCIVESKRTRKWEKAREKERGRENKGGEMEKRERV